MAEPSNTPFFIVGAGRSGTTFLRSLFSAHSRLAVTPETHFCKFALASQDARRGMAQAMDHLKIGERLGDGPLDFPAFWHFFSRSLRFRDLGIDADACRARLPTDRPPGFREIMAALLAEYAARTGKPRVGEKTPSHSAYLPELLSWFPDARVIFVRRDPRACIASQLKTPWAQAHMTPPGLRSGVLVGSRLVQVARFADDWMDVHEKARKEWQDDPRVIVQSYESLVRDPESQMRRLCEFLGEAYEPAMLEKRSEATVPAPAGGNALRGADWRDWRKAHHARTLAPVSADSIEKWRDQLTLGEVAIIEGRCAEGMRAASYDFATRTGRLLGGMGVRAVRAGETVESSARTLGRRLGIDRLLDNRQRAQS